MLGASAGLAGADGAAADRAALRLADRHTARGRHRSADQVPLQPFCRAADKGIDLYLPLYQPFRYHRCIF